MSQVRRVTFKLEKHPNADRLSIASIDGTDWRCVTATDQWGDTREGLYVAIDSLVSVERAEFEFLRPKADKVMSDGTPASRVKTIRLRGALSQGLLVPIGDDVRAHLDFGDPVGPEFLDNLLRVERYEPPVPTSFAGGMVRQPGAFALYAKAPNAKNCPRAFAIGEAVRVTEKLHGTSFRAGFVAEDVSTRPVYMVGSHATARDPESDNLYSTIARRDVHALSLGEAIAESGLSFKRNLILFGEVYGSKVQDLAYGCKPGEQRLALFDVMIDDAYQGWHVVEFFAAKLGLQTVPLLYRGPFTADTTALRDGRTTLPGATHVREGVVITSEDESSALLDGAVQRKSVKFISDDYLTRSGERDGH